MRPIVLLSSIFLVACGNAGATDTTDADKAESPAAAAAKAEKTQKPYAKAQIAVAESAEVPDVVIVTGTVQPFDRADVVPAISGKVIEVLVERGSVVAAGDPLVRLDTRNAALSEREARANLASLSSQKRLADETCRRSKELLDKGAITRAEYDRDMTGCAQARAAVSAASARVAQTDKAQADGLVVAPFGGTIAERWISLGEWASPQGKLFTLVDDHELRVDLSLSESAAVHAKVGTVVSMNPVAERERMIEAPITRLGVEIDPRTRALLAEVTLPKGSGLQAGMFVEGRMAVGARTLPVVPKSALVQRGSTWRIFVSIGDRLEERVVQLGPDVGDQSSVVRGLEVGESFATVVTEDAVDGAAVK